MPQKYWKWLLFWREEGRTCLKSVLERLIDLGLVTFSVEKWENFKVGAAFFDFFTPYLAYPSPVHNYDFDACRIFQ